MTSSTSAPTAENVENTVSPSPDGEITSSMEEHGVDQSTEDSDLVSSAASEPEELVEEEEIPSLTPTQLNTVNMLNYMTALTQNVTEERKNQLFLETAYNSFDNAFASMVLPVPGRP